MRCAEETSLGVGVNDAGGPFGAGAPTLIGSTADGDVNGANGFPC